MVQTRVSLLAIDVQNGTLLWSTRIAPLGVTLASSPSSGQAPALCDDRLYATSLDALSGASWLYAVDATSGNVTWFAELDAPRANATRALSVTSPAVNAWCRYAFVGSSFGVHAFDLWNGSRLDFGAQRLGLCGAQVRRRCCVCLFCFV